MAITTTDLVKKSVAVECEVKKESPIYADIFCILMFFSKQMNQFLDPSYNLSGGCTRHIA